MHLAPNSEILSDPVLNALIVQVTGLINAVPVKVEDSLQSVLEAATLNISVNLCIIGSGPNCTVPLVDVGTGIQVSVPDQTLGDIVNGTATASITLKVAGLPITVPLGDLLNALTGPIVDVLLGENGVVKTVIPTVTGLVTGLVTELSPVLGAINGLVSLKGNVQEQGSNGPDSYREVALRATVGDILGSNEIVGLDLATAEVGANVYEDAADTDADADKETPGKTTGKDNLAKTGMDSSAAITASAIGVLLLLAGAALIIARKRNNA